MNRPSLLRLRASKSRENIDVRVGGRVIPVWKDDLYSPVRGPIGTPRTRIEACRVISTWDVDLEMAEFELREGDVPGLVDRLTELHAAYYGRRWKLGPRFESDIVTGIAEFAGRYDPSRDGIWTVVSDDDIVRGGIIIDARDVDERGAQLRYFVLASDLHGRGFGRRLLETAVAFCDDQGYERVFLWTVDELEAAIRLYRDVGFTPTETIDSILTGRRTFRTVCLNGRTNIRVADGCFPVLKRLFSSSRTIRQ